MTKDNEEKNIPLLTYGGGSNIPKLPYTDCSPSDDSEPEFQPDHRLCGGIIRRSSIETIVEYANRLQRAEIENEPYNYLSCIGPLYHAMDTLREEINSTAKGMYDQVSQDMGEARKLTALKRNGWDWPNKVISFPFVLGYRTLKKLGYIFKREPKYFEDEF